MANNNNNGGSVVVLSSLDGGGSWSVWGTFPTRAAADSERALCYSGADPEETQAILPEGWLALRVGG